MTDRVSINLLMTKSEYASIVSHVIALFKLIQDL